MINAPHALCLSAAADSVRAKLRYATGHFALRSVRCALCLMPYAACVARCALSVAKFRCLKLKDLRLKDLCFYEVLSIKR